MLEPLYKKLDAFRENITDVMDENLIREKEKECNVKFPEAMVDFYLHFGNDRNVLLAYYLFDDIEDIEIQNGTLLFGAHHQGSERLGIRLQNPDSPYQSICRYSYERKEWLSEGAVSLESFFFNIACWQVMNTMESMAEADVSQTQFEEIANKHFSYFSNETKICNGYNIVSIYTDTILGCYIKDAELLYLATNEDDEVLAEYEEKLNLDLDWL